MKKLIALIYMFSAAIAFSAVPSEEAVFSVRMKLIDPLSVKIEKNMDFGTISKGSTKEVEAVFTLKGEPGKGYSVEINGGKNQSELVHSKDTANKIPVELSVDKNLEGVLNEGETAFKVIGKAVYAQENSLQAGEYNGTITIRVNYN